MIDKVAKPLKAGWYWLRRVGDPFPEVCFWSGSSFLTITPDRPILDLSEVELCCGGPLQPPDEFLL